MGDFALKQLLKEAGQRMTLDLSQRLVPHPGELGADREEVIRRFLQDYLPKRFEVSSGFVFDCHGTVSQQLDIIISQSLVAPRFEVAGGRRFYPCESVVAVGQVKSSLTTRKEFASALANLESVKSLDRSGGGHSVDRIFGEQLDHVGNYLHQIFTFLFVSGKTLAGDTVHEEMVSHVTATDAHLWPNIIFALNHYLVTFCCDSGVCPNPMDARGIALQDASSGGNLLMKFYLMLGAALDVTRVSGLPYWDYLQQGTSWSAKVFFAATDDPPPRLSSIPR